MRTVIGEPRLDLVAGLVVALGRVLVLLLLPPSRRPPDEIRCRSRSRSPARRPGPGRSDPTGSRHPVSSASSLVRDLEPLGGRGRGEGLAQGGLIEPQRRYVGGAAVEVHHVEVEDGGHVAGAGPAGWSASAWEPISPDSSAANPTKMSERVGPDPASDERLGGGQHRRGARGVVLGPVVDRVAVHRRADPEVVVVAADQHRFARQGPAARGGGRGRWRSRCGGWRSAPSHSTLHAQRAPP